MQLILPAEHFIFTGTIPCQSPTRALAAWPPRLCSHRNQGSFQGSKDIPELMAREHNFLTTAFRFCKILSKCGPKLCFSNANASTRRNCFHGDWENDFTAWLSPCSLLFLAEKERNLNTARHCETFASIPLKALLNVD